MESDIWKSDTLPNPDLYWDIPGYPDLPRVSLFQTALANIRKVILPFQQVGHGFKFFMSR